jgi:hypothetical protein
VAICAQVQPACRAWRTWCSSHTCATCRRPSTPSSPSSGSSSAARPTNRRRARQPWRLRAAQRVATQADAAGPAPLCPSASRLLHRSSTCLDNRGRGRFGTRDLLTWANPLASVRDNGSGRDSPLRRKPHPRWLRRAPADRPVWREAPVTQLVAATPLPAPLGRRTGDPGGAFWDGPWFTSPTVEKSDYREVLERPG